MGQEKTSTRRHDPRRRERIIDAAVRMVSRDAMLTEVVESRVDTTTGPA